MSPRWVAALFLACAVAVPTLAAPADVPRTPTRPPETGETRLSIDVRDASIADIVLLLAEIGGFQVVLDPGVSCKLTVKLKEVPWPKVLDVALQSCRLASEEDGGVVRVATAARLMEETAAQRKLAEEKRLSGPLRARRHRLSYAEAKELAPVIKKLLSPRGEVIVDERTNTLIVIDVD